MFWPGRDPDRARASLRTTLGYLRQTLGDAAGAFLETTRHTIALTPSNFLTVDIKLLDRARLLATRMASAPGLVTQLEQGAAEYRGPFLADLTLPDVPAVGGHRHPTGARLRRAPLGGGQRAVRNPADRAIRGRWGTGRVWRGGWAAWSGRRQRSA